MAEGSGRSAIDMPGRRTTFCCILLISTLGGVAPCAAQTLSQEGYFDHPPLQYLGPDPTANYYLPGAMPPAATNAPLLSPAIHEFAQPSHLYQYPPQLPEHELRQKLSFDPDAVSAPHITPHKDGFFQKLCFTGTYIDRGSLDSYGVDELDLCATFAMPAPSRDWPLLITPAFNVRYLDGPLSPDLPPRLYETYLDFTWVPRVSPRWTGIIGVAPSFYSDFHIDENDAWRLTGKGLARYDWVPDRFQLIFGVLYLNREDVRLLPAGGIIWVPSPDKRYEVLFPRPKLAHRIDYGPGFEDWLYLGGEFGGNSWPVDLGGTTDTITLRDYRILLGLERKLNGGAGFRIEVGYVFSREIEFLSGLPTVEGDDTALVRGGVTY